MKVAGVLLMLAGVMFGIGLSAAPGAPPALLVVPPALLVGGGFTFYRGRQHRSRAIAADLHSPGPRVLYLRAFASDPTTVKQALSPLLTAYLLSGLSTEEEQLAEVVQPLGRMVAIGRPGERLPTPGAARMYADDHEWQATVNEQLGVARLVIIRVGSGGGLQWELHRAKEVVLPSRLLLLVSGLKKRESRAVAGDLRAVFGAELPDSLLSNSIFRRSGFVRFSSRWEPEYLRARAPYFRRSSYKYFKAGATYALRPVFEQFQIPWSQPKVSKLAMLPIVVVALVVLLFLFAVALS